MYHLPIIIAPISIMISTIQIQWLWLNKCECKKILFNFFISNKRMSYCFHPICCKNSSYDKKASWIKNKIIIDCVKKNFTFATNCYLKKNHCICQYNCKSAFPSQTIIIFIIFFSKTPKIITNPKSGDWYKIIDKNNNY